MLVKDFLFELFARDSWEKLTFEYAHSSMTQVRMMPIQDPFNLSPCFWI